MFFYLRRNLKLIFLLSIINLNFLLTKNSFCADIENLGSISSTSSHSGVINNSNNITNLTESNCNSTAAFNSFLRPASESPMLSKPEMKMNK